MLTPHNIEKTKRCRVCRTERPISQFGKRDIKKYENTCKDCRRLAAAQLRTALKALVDEYTGDKCVMCGLVRTEETRAAFHLHHVDPSKKERLVGEVIGLVAIGRCSLEVAWRRVKAELEKTIHVCAICHARIHYNMKKEEDHYD